MNPNDCPKEVSVLAALANDSMSDELAAHLNFCAVCQDASLVWSFLQASAEAEADPPPAGIIWWKAQLARKRVAARRSVAFIETMQKIALAVTLIVLIALGASQAAKLWEVPPLLLAGSAAIFVLFLASVIVVLRLGRDSHHRTLRDGLGGPRGM